MMANNSPTIFTDDDFDRLKGFKSKYQYFNFPTAWDVNEAYDLIEGLLARLEAAENAIAHSHGPASSWCCHKAKDLDQEWRKAAGKLEVS